MTTTNGTNAAKPKPTRGQQQHPLVGRFFHTTHTCPHGVREAVWQGHVLAAVTADVLLIELFEWVTGCPNGQELITLADFMAKNPVLYSNNEQMIFGYQHGDMGHHCAECRANRMAEYTKDQS